jgi:F0F1-type ATP synthase alpha subunit
MLLAATEGCFDKVEISKIKNAEGALLREFKSKHGKLLEKIDAGTEPDDKEKEAILALAKKVAESYHPEEASMKDERRTKNDDNKTLDNKVGK